MNTELLEKIAAHIEAHPETYNQANWCGTACCIAGHALALSGRGASDSVEEEAAELLKLTLEESDRLFICEPRRFKGIWPSQGFPDKERAQMGAARIRHFIATEGRE